MAAPAWQANGSFSSSVVGAANTGAGWPTHQINDLGILLVKTNNEAPSLSVPNGFTAIEGADVAQGTVADAASCRLTAFYCFATSASMSAPTIDAVTNSTHAVIMTWRGVYIGSVPRVGGSDATGTGTSVSVPGGATRSDNCLALAACAHSVDLSGARFASWTNTDLSSFTERFDNGSTVGFGGGLSVAAGSLATRGTYGVSTATMTGGSLQASFSLVLQSLAEITDLPYATGSKFNRGFN
jgi:hypothetical protein